MRRPALGVILVVSLAVFALAGCGGGSSKSSSAGGGGSTTLPPCPLASLQSAKKPVEITYWHAMTVANEDELKKLTAQFNAQQHDVHVTLSGAPSYPDNLTRLKSGVDTGVLLTIRSPDSRCAPDHPSRRKPLAYCRCRLT